MALCVFMVKVEYPPEELALKLALEFKFIHQVVWEYANQFFIFLVIESWSIGYFAVRVVICQCKTQRWNWNVERNQYTLNSSFRFNIHFVCIRWKYLLPRGPECSQSQTLGSVSLDERGYISLGIILKPDRFSNILIVLKAPADVGVTSGLARTDSIDAVFALALSSCSRCLNWSS